MTTTTSNVKVGKKLQSGQTQTSLAGSSSDVNITIDTATVTTREQLISAANAVADHLSLK